MEKLELKGTSYNAAETGILKRFRRTSVVLFLLVASVLMPDTLRMSSGAGQSLVIEGSSGTCESVDLWNVPRLEITANLEVLTRPSDYAVVWSSTLDHEEGLALTMDRFGNLFLSAPSAQWGANNPVVFLLSGPFEPGTRHEVAVVAAGGAILSARVDGADVNLRSLDGTVNASDQILKTAVNRLCVGQSTIRPVAGDVQLLVLGGVEPRTFQLTLLRVMLMVLSLVLFLRTDQPRDERQDDKEEEAVQ